ncbi:hypothetical protein IJE86_09355, partial [bacterium]|nr:hypothetical protein [bacterium]
MAIPTIANVIKASAIENAFFLLNRGNLLKLEILFSSNSPPPLLNQPFSYFTSPISYHSFNISEVNTF